jgi:glycyl-tRNA synthetase
LCKNRGFVFAGSDIYGGLANTWDFGPLGVELKNNIKGEWWKYFVTQNDNSVGLDGGILLNPRVWVASGHVASFSDPLMDCRACKTRHRADKLIESASKGKVNPDFQTNEWLQNWIADNGVKCPNCGKIEWTNIRQFNLMFKTNRGVVENGTDDGAIYLRPETAQNQFVDFLNVQRTMRLRVPFGIGQIGKAFRNEITPGNFIFRTIEFEQMEHQFFCRADESEKFYKTYKDKAFDFYTSRLGLDKHKLRFKDHEHLCHYAKMACDMEFDFPTLGFSEIGGTHHRGTWDLSQHQKTSGKSQEYTDPVTNEKFIPTVIESSHGCDRLFLACLANAYNEEKLDKDDTRIVLKLHPRIAPYKAAILPLQKKEQGETANKIYRDLIKHFPCTYDETASIGKRYRRQDEIGTPFCITVDFDTEKDNSVTVRDRDTMKQERIKIDKLEEYINAKIK